MVKVWASGAISNMMILTFKVTVEQTQQNENTSRRWIWTRVLFQHEFSNGLAVH